LKVVDERPPTLTAAGHGISQFGVRRILGRDRAEEYRHDAGRDV
jgi:hypothetical protein